MKTPTYSLLPDYLDITVSHWTFRLQAGESAAEIIEEGDLVIRACGKDGQITVTENNLIMDESLQLEIARDQDRYAWWQVLQVWAAVAPYVLERLQPFDGE